MRRFILAAASLAALAILALSPEVPRALAQFIPPTSPIQIGNTDLIPCTPGGVPTANQPYCQAVQLAGYVGSLPTKGNVLIGGDASTNLFQRATSGSSVTTTVTYGGPDRWAYWSGTSTAMTVSQDTTAADLRPNTKAAFKMARTSGQTGVVQMCMLQEVESVNVYPFQGQIAELDFDAITGANFSPASGNLTAYIITGTGTDQGVAGSASVAFGLNAGGGGSGGWTGQANATAAVIATGAAGSSGRYAAIGTIPAGATEIAVAICMTPVGTAGTNDYVALQNIQLVRNPAAKVNTLLGYSCDNQSNALMQCTAFDRSRNAAVEASLQQRYYYQLTETAAIVPVAPCSAVDTTHTNCLVQFPVPMRAAPALTFANGFASPTSTTQATLGACTTLTAATTVASTVAGTLNALVNCAATTIPAAGIASFLYSNNGTGTIKANAEL
jgi:hypothetical protein